MIFRKILPHVTMILAMMFLLFVVLDAYNPMMEFLNNDISKGLLIALCVSALGSGILLWRSNRRHAAMQARRHAEKHQINRSVRTAAQQKKN